MPAKRDSPTTPAAEPTLDSVDDSGWQVPDALLHELAPRATKYCVCIPVLNEGKRVRVQLERMQALHALPDVVVADGGSDDGSVDPAALQALGVTTLLVKRGPGRLGAQLRIGFAHCLRQGYEGIVTVDGNNKDGVEAIPRFVEALENGADFVQGSRFVAGGRAINTPWLRLLAIRLIHAPVVSLAAGHRYTDTTNGFRAYSRRLLLHPGVRPFRETFGNYELLWYLAARAPRVGCRAIEIPVERRYPEMGPTPTKISPLAGSGRLLGELWRLLRGDYDPPAGHAASPTSGPPASDPRARDEPAHDASARRDPGVEATRPHEDPP